MHTLLQISWTHTYCWLPLAKLKLKSNLNKSEIRGVRQSRKIVTSFHLKLNDRVLPSMAMHGALFSFHQHQHLQHSSLYKLHLSFPSIEICHNFFCHINNNHIFYIFTEQTNQPTNQTNHEIFCSFRRLFGSFLQHSKCLHNTSLISTTCCYSVHNGSSYYG